MPLFRQPDAGEATPRSTPELEVAKGVPSRPITMQNDPMQASRLVADARIDGRFRCARSLAFAQAILENPDRYLGSPDGAEALIPATRLPSS